MTIKIQNEERQFIPPCGRTELVRERNATIHLYPSDPP